MVSTNLNSLFIGFGMAVEPPKSQSICPFLLVEVKQHLLLKFVFPVIDGYGVVMSIQTMDQRLIIENHVRFEFSFIKDRCRLNHIFQDSLEWKVY